MSEPDDLTEFLLRLKAELAEHFDAVVEKAVADYAIRNQLEILRGKRCPVCGK